MVGGFVMNDGGSTEAMLCTAFRPFERNTLQGFADLWLKSWHMTLHGVTVHQKGDQRWVGLPAKPQLDQDRNLVGDDHGKIQYFPCISLDAEWKGDHFTSIALDAIDAFTAAENGGAGGDPDDELGF